MPSIDRRTFLATGSSALLLSGSRFQSPVRRPGQTVVVCFLRGGADGLSMVIPHGDPQYYRARPHLAVPRRDVLDLDGYFGLHPALAALKPWWDNNSLAVAPAAGIPGALRSHVDAEARLRRLWQNNTREVVVIERGGWDTHLNQGTRDGLFAARLRALAGELAELARHHSTVVTVSEFGRAIHENGTGGTDHGRASAMLMLGGAIRGGVIGAWPGLDGADVAVTTDYSHTFA
jgi:uncharacterized protein (DUF1501 family)